jgi:hypothetical protein
MKKGQITKPLALIGLAAITGIVYARVVRPWMLRWGATLEEVNRPLPGDEVIPDPAMSTTHAILIRAPREVVWQWLIQIGQGRGGFYSYESLENLIGLDIHNTDEIHPELQNPQVGGIIPFWKEGGIPILKIEPPQLLVLGGSFAPDQPAGGSWVFQLQSPDPEITRLIVRTKVAGFPPVWLSTFLYRILLEPAQFIMERGMLLGIKKRAEKLIHLREQ